MRVLEALAKRDDDPEWGISALCADLVTPGQSRDRVLAMLGGSTALVDHLVRHPEHWLDASRATRHTSEQVRESSSARSRTSAATCRPMTRCGSPTAAG